MRCDIVGFKAQHHLGWEKTRSEETRETLERDHDGLDHCHCGNSLERCLGDKFTGFAPVQYSCLENPMDGEPGGLQPIGPLRVEHN